MDVRTLIPAVGIAGCCLADALNLVVVGQSAVLTACTFNEVVVEQVE
jgi:hypothetical protein